MDEIKTLLAQLGDALTREYGHGYDDVSVRIQARVIDVTTISSERRSRVFVLSAEVEQTNRSNIQVG